MLVVLAHHDDENGIALRMLRLQDADQEIHVAWLTDSAFGTTPGVRKRESRCAMEILGVPASRLHFIGEELQLGEWKSIIRKLPEAVDRLAALIAEVRPWAIYVVAYEGGNIEHDAVHLATLLAVRRTGVQVQLFEYPLYNAGGESWPHYQVAEFATAEGSVLADIPTWSEARRLSEAAACFATQGAHVWGGALVANLRAFSRGIVFRSVPERLHPVRPHSGRLNYEGLSWYVKLVRLWPAVESVFGTPFQGSFDEIAEAVDRVGE